MRGPDPTQPAWIREWYPGTQQLEWDIPLVMTPRGPKRHGTAIQYHPNGQVKLTREYVDGHEDGVERLYDQAGELVHELSFKAGRKHGPYRTYAGGKIRSEVMFSQGKRV